MPLGCSGGFSVTCPYCSQANVPVELFGFAIHKLSDRWIACTAREHYAPFYDGVIAAEEDHNVSHEAPPARAQAASAHFADGRAI